MIVRSLAAAFSADTECFSAHDALHPRFRLRSLIQRGVAIDDELLFRRAVRWTGRGDDRALLTIVLDGHQRVSWPGAPDRWLMPGEFALCSAFGPISRRDEGESAHALSIEWLPGSLAGRPAEGVAYGKLTTPDLIRLRDLSFAFRACGVDATAATTPLAAMLAVLRSAGVPFDPGAVAPELMNRGARRFAALSGAIDRAISTKGTLSTSAELESAVDRSRWGIARGVGAMNDYLGLNGRNWRETREAWRMFFASVLATHRDATTEAVARALGYAGPSGLCNTLARRGLPSPSRMRQAVDALL